VRRVRGSRHRLSPRVTSAPFRIPSGAPEWVSHRGAGARKPLERDRDHARAEELQVELQGADGVRQPQLAGDEDVGGEQPGVGLREREPVERLLPGRLLELRLLDAELERPWPALLQLAQEGRAVELEGAQLPEAGGEAAGGRGGAIGFASAEADARVEDPEGV